MALSSVARFSAPKHRPKCAAGSQLTSQYTSISAPHSNFTIYLAVDLQDAQWVLPTFIHELASLLSFMGSHRFHLSIFENGSTDLSPSLLVTLARVLAASGSSYRIVVQGEGVNSHKENGHRIVELSRFRNAALHGLYTGDAAAEMGIEQFDIVLFMNDIVWCASDILEILYQHVARGAHMTCATDWGSDVVYDRWVARTMSGLPFYSQDALIQYFNGPKAFRPPIPRPFPYDEHERNQFGSLQPFQVFSCWNGAAVIDAGAFFAPSEDIDIPGHMRDRHEHPQSAHANSRELSDRLYMGSDDTTLEDVAFSGSSRGMRFRTALNDISTVTEKASECFLLCVDLWRRGMGKIMLVPKASVAYDLGQYARVRQDGGRTVPHPIDIEPPVLSGIDLSRHSASSTENFKGPRLEGEGNWKDPKKIRWVSDPPPSVIYHDYAWWHERERWGGWDEA